MNRSLVQSYAELKEIELIVLENSDCVEWYTLNLLKIRDDSTTELFGQNLILIKN